MGFADVGLPPLSASLLSQVAEIRDYCDQAHHAESENIVETRVVEGPMLLDGFETPPDLESILSDVPPQDIANKLVSRYFNGVEFPTSISSSILVLMSFTDLINSNHSYANV